MHSDLFYSRTTHLHCQRKHFHRWLVACTHTNCRSSVVGSVWQSMQDIQHIWMYVYAFDVELKAQHTRHYTMNCCCAADDLRRRDPHDNTPFGASTMFTASDLKWWAFSVPKMPSLQDPEYSVSCHSFMQNTKAFVALLESFWIFTGQKTKKLRSVGQHPEPYNWSAPEFHSHPKCVWCSVLST